MFTVYKITNLINNQCYIGSSTRVEKRWKDHRNAAFNPNNSNYNYPLYQAFREFGLKNFSFEIIADDFNNVWEMEEYEQKMINEYNSLKPNGYNQTKWTHSNNILSENCIKHIKKISKKCAKVDINENIIEIYSSYHDAARKNNRDGDLEATHVRAVCKGDISSCFDGLYFRDLDENGSIISKPIKNIHGKKHIIGISVDDPSKEIYFNSISEAAKELNIDRSSLSACVNGSSRYSIVNKYIWREIDIYGNIIDFSPSIDDKLEEYNKQNPLINGERHTITEWCKIYNISKTTVYNRINKGMDVVTAITTPKRR